LTVIAASTEHKFNPDRADIVEDELVFDLDPDDIEPCDLPPGLSLETRH
jgi:hypothetical protein